MDASRRSAIATVVVTVLWPHLARAADKIVLGVTAFPPLVGADGVPGYMDLVVREAFARLGIEARIENLPGDRALRMSNEGLTDGEALRAQGLESEYPNLVRVPEPVFESEFMAWSMDRGARLDGWRGLHSLVIGYPIGWKVYDREVKQAREIIRVRSMEQLFPMLAAGRIDVALLDRWQGMYLASRAGIDARPIEPALARLKMFVHLNVRHKALVAPLAGAIAAIHADGTVKRIYDQTLKVYSSK